MMGMGAKASFITIEQEGQIQQQLTACPGAGNSIT
jgi:hypothetical protein